MENNSINQTNASQANQGVDNQFIAPPVSSTPQQVQNQPLPAAPTLQTLPRNNLNAAQSQASIQAAINAAIPMSTPVATRPQEQLMSVEQTLAQQLPKEPPTTQPIIQEVSSQPVSSYQTVPLPAPKTKFRLSRNNVIAILGSNLILGLATYLILYFQLSFGWILYVALLLGLFTYSIIHGIKLRRNPEDNLTERQKNIISGVSSLIGLLATLGYLMGIGKTRPASRAATKSISIYSWLAGIAVGTAIAGIIYPLILGSYISSFSWKTSYLAKFNSSISSIQKDFNSLKVDLAAQDQTSALSDCTQLSSDIGTLSSIKPYPIKSVSDGVKTGINNLKKGAEDCISALQQGDSVLFSTATSELNTGSTQIAAAVKKT